MLCLDVKDGVWVGGRAEQYLVISSGMWRDLIRCGEASGERKKIAKGYRSLCHVGCVIVHCSRLTSALIRQHCTCIDLCTLKIKFPEVLGSNTSALFGPIPESNCVVSARLGRFLKSMDVGLLTPDVSKQLTLWYDVSGCAGCHRPWTRAYGPRKKLHNIIRMLCSSSGANSNYPNISLYTYWTEDGDDTP